MSFKRKELNHCSNLNNDDRVTLVLVLTMTKLLEEQYDAQIS